MKTYNHYLTHETNVSHEADFAILKVVKVEKSPP